MTPTKFDKSKPTELRSPAKDCSEKSSGLVKTIEKVKRTFENPDKPSSSSSKAPRLELEPLTDSKLECEGALNQCLKGKANYAKNLKILLQSNYSKKFDYIVKLYEQDQELVWKTFEDLLVEEKDKRIDATLPKAILNTSKILLDPLNKQFSVGSFFDRFILSDELSCFTIITERDDDYVKKNRQNYFFEALREVLYEKLVDLPSSFTKHWVAVSYLLEIHEKHPWLVKKYNEEMEDIGMSALISSSDFKELDNLLFA